MKPVNQLPKEELNEKQNEIDNKSLFSIISWNIGYGGLGNEMDFFYEGGVKVRPSKNYYNVCFNGILKQLQKFKDADFILLQEIDIKSKRSFYTNQLELVLGKLFNHLADFAINHKTLFAPLPLSKPLGKILSGQATFSKYKPSNVSTIYYPNLISWIKKPFYPKRCILMTKYRISTGKFLVIIHTHNSALAEGEVNREKELQHLLPIIEKEYTSGNYIIIGGDWNQNPALFDGININDGNKVEIYGNSFPENWLTKDWQWAYDPTSVTNRDVSKEFYKNSTKTTIFDYFIVSPNIKIESIEGYRLDFEFSDHNPVELKFSLK